MNEFQEAKKRLIIAYKNHHLTWKELMEAIDSLQFDALLEFQNIEAA